MIMAKSETTNSRKVIVEPTEDHAAATAGQLFKTIVCQAVAEKGTCCAAFSGGTTPHKLYQSLACSAVTGEVPWEQVELFFGDERDVPQDHTDSNYHMVQRTLLDHVPIDPRRVHPMPADRDQLDTAAAEYEQVIHSIVPAGDDGIARFDLILLGMGQDGHVASLFPATPALDEQKKLVAAHYVPALGRWRMTFTFPLINAARQILLLVTGNDKAQAVADILSGDPARSESLPASRIAPRDGVLFMVLDAAAARLSGLRPEEEKT